MTQIVTVPYKPRPSQRVIHGALEVNRFGVLVAHRRFGKSVLGINHTIKKAVQNLLREPRYAFIAPFLKQAKMIAWNYLKRYAMAIPGTIKSESELWVEFAHNKARIQLFGADNAEAIRGTYLDGAWLDEYGNWKFGIFDEIIRSTLIDRMGWTVFNGTPKGQNAFYEVWQLAQKYMASKNPKHKGWWAGMFRADETGVIPAEELELLRQSLPERVFRQEFLCDFTASADNVLITIDLVVDAVGKVLAPSSVDGAAKIIGVDVARFGDDRFVIQRRQGLQAFTPKTFSKLDNMAAAAMVAQEINEFRPDAVFIDGGRGEGVIDRLRQLGYKVQEVNFGGTPIQPAVYADKRAEMWDTMREWLEQGGALPAMPELKSDLVVPTYSFDAANRMRLESKDKIKERLGKSPDLGDALALTFAYPVQANATPYVVREFAAGQQEWNPFESPSKVAQNKTWDPFK